MSRQVVVGASSLGLQVVRGLLERDEEVVVLDRDPDRLREVEEQLDVATLEGAAISPRDLARACGDGAELLVAVTDRDDSNLVAAIAGREAGAASTVARVQGVAFDAGEVRGIHRGLLGIHMIVHPRVLVAQEIARIVRSHGALDILALADGRVELAEVELPAGSRLVHRPLAELTWPVRALVVAVVREGELFVPGGSDVLLPGDRAWLVGRAGEVDRVVAAACGTRPPARVVLVGGGAAGQAIARALQGTGVDLLVIERDPREARRIAERFPDVEVVVGDGTDLALLREERVSRRDLFCAVSHDDEVNLMSALLARRVGAPRTVALAHRPDVQPVFLELGVDVALSPRQVAAEAILDLARPGSLRAVTALHEGAAEVLRFRVPSRARIASHDLARLQVPRGAIVAAILRGDRVLVPEGRDRVQEDDEVLVVATPGARPAVERLFRPPLV